MRNLSEFQKYFCISLVIFGFGVPLCLRIDSWPWTNYPMYSRKVDLENLRVFQVFLKNIDGVETRLSLLPGRVGDVMIAKTLAAHPDEKTLKKVLLTVIDDSRAQTFKSGEELIIYMAGASLVNKKYVISRDFVSRVAL